MQRAFQIDVVGLLFLFVYICWFAFIAWHLCP